MNKFYFNHLKNTTLTSLVKIKFNSVVQILSNTTDINFSMTITPNGVIYSGKYEYTASGTYYDARNNFQVYKNTSTNEYYICVVGNPAINYFSLELISKANEGGIQLAYDEAFDATGLTLLGYENPMPVMNREVRYLPTVDANTVTEYKSKCGYKSNMSQCSLVMFSIRNNNNVGVSALILLHRKTASTLTDTPEWSLQFIYNESGISAFSLTGTKDGFTFTSNAAYRYAITEIANPTEINTI